MLALALVVAVTAAVSPAVPAGAAAASCKIAVLSVEASGVGDDALAAALTEAVAGGVREASGCQVITPKDVRSMLSFAADRASCTGDDASCIAELGTALGVDRVVATNVARLGHAWSTSVRLIDIDHAQVLAGKERVVDGDAVKLREAVRDLASAAVGGRSSLGNGLVYGGAIGGAVGVVTLLVGGGVFLWSSTTLADKSAGSVDKANALALYTPAIAVAVVGGIVTLAGAGVAVAGVVTE